MIYSENGIWSNHIIRIFCFIFSGIAPTLCSKVLFYYSFGKKLDLKNPQTLDEKLMWLKLNTYKDNPLVAQCIDKYAVRFYIESQGCSELLNDLIGVWKRAEEIPFSELPQKFVLKCNHGCGYNIICRDKSIFDSKAAVKRLKHWLREDFWRRFAEINYKTIPPKIICEAYIDENINQVPTDYKFYCFHGRALYVMVCVGREKGKGKYYFFDRNWKLQRINPDSIAAPDNFSLPKPYCLEKMFAYADKLSAPFPFVRIDLYSVEQRVIFGEFTFTPSAALDTARLPETDRMFGELLNIH